MGLVHKVVLSIALLSFFSCNAHNGKHLLTVYYEGLCPYTADFVLEQLDPGIKQLKDYISISMIPFGKAHRVSGDLICQHGPKECLSNMVQDCVLYNMRSKSDVEKVSYVACEMRTLAASRGSYECVQDVEFAKKCVNSQLGKTLQSISENRTNVVHPKGIPLVTLDGVVSEDFENKAIDNLVSAVCEVLGNVPPCHHKNAL